MPNRVRVVVVGDGDRAELVRRARSKSEPARVVQRARIVLLSERGLTGPVIAERVGCTEPTVITWRSRYAEHGMAGLSDAPRPGGPGAGDDPGGGRADLGGHRDPAAAGAAGAGGDALVGAAAVGLAGRSPRHPGQPRLDRQTVATVLPGPAPD